MQRYFAKEKKGDIFILQDDDIYHIRTVMRMQTKDLVEIVWNENVYICRIEKSNKEIQIKMTNECKIDIVKEIPVHLILPLVKEQKMDLILQKTTELGISSISWYNAERSIVKLDQNQMLKKIERWQKIVKEASEQSKRQTIPILLGLKTMDELQSLEGKKYICSTEEKQNSMKKVLKKNPNCDKMNIVIGPEGGLSNKEEEQFKKIGFEPITLGMHILRVETVPIYLLSVINYEYME